MLKVKKRSKKTTQLFNSYYPFENRLGKRYQILVTEESTDKRYYVGHNKFYEQILVDKNDCNLGEWIEVEITSFGKHHMNGRLISTTNWGFGKTWARYKEILTNNRTRIKQIWFPTCLLILTSSLMYKLFRKIL